MKHIGGLFPTQTVHPDLHTQFPFAHDDMALLMSGRCGLSHVLADLDAQGESTRPRRVYMPVYTCETVMAPFEKAGYELVFYRVDRRLIPHFLSEDLRGCGAFLLTGYYGFSTWREGTLDGRPPEDLEAWLEALSAAGIKLIFDLTHTLFDPEPLPRTWDYAAGSARKWLGIPSGGFAFKHHGTFDVQPRPADERHIALRKQALDCAARLQQGYDEETAKELDESFWTGELYLRTIFDNMAGDPESAEIAAHLPIAELTAARRANYAELLSLIPRRTEYKGTLIWQVVLPELTEGVCPSHFTLLSDDREPLMAFLRSRGIKVTTYWPISPAVHGELAPAAADICDHIFSIPCDQRFGPEDMRYIAEALEDYLKLLPEGGYKPEA